MFIACSCKKLFNFSKFIVLPKISMMNELGGLSLNNFFILKFVINFMAFPYIMLNPVNQKWYSFCWVVKEKAK